MSNLQQTPIKEIVYFGDFHLHSKLPRARPDLTLDKCLGKLSQILRYARENRCYMVDGGDLFHVSELNATDLISVYSYFHHSLVLEQYMSPCLFSVLGNHDIIGYSMADYYKSAHQCLNQLFQLETSRDNYFGKATSGELPEFTLINKKEGLSGSDSIIRVYTFDATKSLDDYAELIKTYSHPEPFFTFAHQPVGKESTMYCKGYQDLPYHPLQKLATWADIHTPFLDKIGNTTIVNNGAICRRNSTEVYQPHFYHLKFDDQANIDAYKIFIEDTVEDPFIRVDKKITTKETKGIKDFDVTQLFDNSALNTIEVLLKDMVDVNDEEYKPVIKHILDGLTTYQSDL